MNAPTKTETGRGKTRANETPTWRPPSYQAHASTAHASRYEDPREVSSSSFQRVPAIRRSLSPRAC